MKILLVEDDKPTAAMIAHSLTNQNYLVEIATDGRQGWDLVKTFEYDLLLLDVMLPHLDGISFCQRLRAEGSRIPIVLLTSRDTDADKVKGLNSGADDYIVKPFNVQELSARLRAVLRRGNNILTPVLEWGTLHLDPNMCVVTYDQKPLSLTPKEYSLLELFLRNPHRVFSSGALLENLWSFQEPPGEDTVRAHIKGLRHKLKAAGAEANLIETVYGLGYRLKPLSEKNKSVPTPSTGNVSTDLSQKQQQIQNTMGDIWEGCKDKFIEQIQFLEQSTFDLGKGLLNADIYKKTQQEAHKLAGSLGMFGFSEGSVLTRDLEKKLENSDSLGETEAKYFYEQLIILRKKIQGIVGESPSQPLRHNAHPLRLLLVDDDTQITEQLSIEALSRGLQVEIANNPSLARKNISNLRPDVVLLDLSFPDSREDAWTFLSELNHQTPPIPVLVFTTRDNFDDRLKVTRLGARGFLHKTMPPSQVMEMVIQLQKQILTVESKVLVLDDDPIMLLALRHLLEPWGINVITLDNPLQFWDALEENAPDLLILDIEMPHLTGIELCQVVRNDPRWNRIPILFLTAKIDTHTIHEVFAAGGDDYVSKPIIEPELLTRILNRLERSQLLRSLAETDALTKVANRYKSTQDLNRFFSLAKRYNQPLSLAIIDLDHFKQVNDQYGHSAGDRVLCRFGERLQHTFRSEDVIGRWGGEEFIIGMYGMNKQDGKQRLMDLQKTWHQEEFIESNGARFHVSFSAGVAEYPEDGMDLQALYRAADVALYRAKIEGRDRIISV